ncbi:YrzE family protein [Paraburkholderia sp. 31.1]|uniref:YrzE family protein n=1 Tax=Paraburkholderia sp. 31.1 TaxID=2615205 RepID=UPI00165645E2|nr:YrzE family protein [Paraburkholderia sp. 31.1]
MLFAGHARENEKMTSSVTAAQDTGSSVFTQTAGAQGLPPLDKIVVAIHGVGRQPRSTTIRAAVRRFGARNEPPLPVLPLGFFNICGVGEVRVSRLDVPRDDELSRIGFAEVYWADIPRDVVKQGDTLEEVKAWGETVAGRARDLYENVEREAKRHGRPALLTPESFSLAAGVIDEIVEAVDVIENLLTVTKKMGVFEFKLGPLLRDYYGDVQLVTDFEYYRSTIVFRFHDVIQQILLRFHKDNPDFKGDPEIHIVAHSEGTAIAFIAMLQALSSNTMERPDDRNTKISTDWIKSVRGFMTIGCPIDKHLLLWPKLWLNLKLESQDFKNQAADAEVVMLERAPNERLVLPQPIKWRNYYDLGDPIGFQLDTTREFLREHQCGAFQFTSDDDFGFSRYWLPGKAHTEYWNDDAVFGHFIENVVLTYPDAPFRAKAPAPGNKRFVGVVSTAIPYVLAFLLHMGALFLLFRAVMASLDLDLDTYPRVTSSVFVLSVLLMCVTIAGRIPRLVRSNDARWRQFCLGAYLFGALFYVLFIPASFVWLMGGFFGSLNVLLCAAILSLSGWVAPAKPYMGRRCLVGGGTLVLALAMVYRLIQAPSSEAMWPVVLAALLSLYLWRLGVMVFDLAFIWHRYIRNSVALDTMRAWRDAHDAEPRGMKPRVPLDRPASSAAGHSA